MLPAMVGSAMSRRVIAIGLAAGVAIAGTASAAPAKKTAGTAGKSARSSRRAGVAKANGSNLPRGFTWPPSQAMAAAEAACERELAAAEVAWKPAPREGHIADALTIEDGALGGIAYAPVFGRGPY